MKRPLICLVTAVAMLLVSSCGAEDSSGLQGVSEPYTVEKRYTNDLTYNLYTFCINKDKVFITSTGLAAIHNHEECK